MLSHNCLEFAEKYSFATSLSLFHFRESLVAAIQQVQSTLSSEEPSSEEAQSDTQGSSSSLALPGGGPKRAETFSGFDTKLKPDNINRASSMRTERPGMVFPSRQLPGAVSPVVGASPKTKHKRRSSGGGGWSFLPKSSSKEHMEQTGSTGIRICGWGWGGGVGLRIFADCHYT